MKRQQSAAAHYPQLEARQSHAKVSRCGPKAFHASMYIAGGVGLRRCVLGDEACEAEVQMFSV